MFNPNWKEKCNVWLSSVRGLLDRFDVYQYIKRTDTPDDIPSWALPKINISYSHIDSKQCYVSTRLLKQNFLTRLHALLPSPNILLTDGSLHDDVSAGAGVVHYKEGGKAEHRTLSKHQRTVPQLKRSSWR